MWQNDLLESRARSRGDVIFFRGGVEWWGWWFRDKMKINLASEKEEGGG